jgi:hypothetical protein
MSVESEDQGSNTTSHPAEDQTTSPGQAQQNPQANPTEQAQGQEPTSNQEQQLSQEEQQAALQAAYSQSLRHFLEDFYTKAKEAGVPVASIIFIDPKLPERPVKLSIGDPYHATLLACEMARHLKQKLILSERLSV